MTDEKKIRARVLRDGLSQGEKHEIITLSERLVLDHPTCFEKFDEEADAKAKQAKKDKNAELKDQIAALTVDVKTITAERDDFKEKYEGAMKKLVGSGGK